MLRMLASWPSASSTASESVGRCSVSSLRRRDQNPPETMASSAACHPVAPLAELVRDAITAVIPFHSAAAAAPNVLDIMLCFASDLLAAIAASEREQGQPRHAPQVWVKFLPLCGL